jgi:O-antigen ligase
MPPQIALLLCITFILYILKLDFQRNPKVSFAIWVPLIWVTILGSRFVSQWIGLEGHGTLEEGSPVDRIFFLMLILIGIIILSRRRISLSQIVLENPWLFLFFLYSGISILWSDFPFVAFKRWNKEIGNLLMVLIILTESDPVEAVSTVIRRCAYILIPLSVIFIKYYPNLGRRYNFWTGEVEYIGVATSKNMLGCLCLVCGFFFIWMLLTMWRERRRPVVRKELIVSVFLFLMTLWVFQKANSETSLVCLIIGVCALIVTGLPIVRKNLNLVVGVCVFFALFFLLILPPSLDKIDVSALGRDATLTGRVPLWKEVIDMHTDPFFGTGYESFWLGDRLAKMSERHWWHPSGAHNGYLETYLNLGWIGIFFLTGIIVSTFRKNTKELMPDSDFGRFQIAFFIMVLIYNVTESGFKGTILIWFIFLLIAVRCPTITVSRS